jgi:calreticulin
VNRWSESKGDLGKWDVTAGNFYADPESSKGNACSLGLKTTEDYRFYALSAPFTEEFNHKDKDFVVQFSVKFEQSIGSYY